MAKVPFRARVLSVFKTKHSSWEIAIAITTIFAFLIAANGYEESQLETRRRVAEESYYQLLENLGSDNVVVRVGAIGQIETVLVRDIPVGGRPKWWEGFAYLLGAHEHPTSHPYHASLLRVISALALSPKERSEASRFEAEAFLTMLCAIGPEGWYEGEARRTIPVREDCLSWIWMNAPEHRLLEAPAYPLFRRSEVRNASFRRYSMRRAEFSEAFLETVDFSEADLRDSRFSDSTLLGALFVNANLEGANFGGASFKGADFAGANLKNADFSGAELIDVSLARAQNLGQAIGIPQIAETPSQDGGIH